MPAAKISTRGAASFVKKAAAEAAEDERCMIALGSMIRMKMMQRGLSPERMALLIGGTCKETFTRRLNHPEKFSYPELLKVFRFLEFDDHDILAVCREAKK